MPDYPPIRLDRVLIQNGYCSPRSARTLLRNHVAQVNGVRVFEGSILVSPTRDIISLDGNVLDLKNNVYLMMNKSANTVCTSLSDSHTTVFDLVDEKYKNISGLGKLHSVGRLDRDTEGLLLLTTNGSFSHSLCTPEKHVSKTYLVYLRDYVSEEKRSEYCRRLKEGIFIEAEKKAKSALTKSAHLEWLSEQEAVEQNPGSNGENHLYTACRLTITEGKFHQVKRMFAALGNEVIYLKRIALGKLSLDPSLLPGEYREMTAEELMLLMEQ